jgi:hypothetical protein
MNNREREHATLSFCKNLDRGAVEETFHPWTLTAENWKSQGVPEGIIDNLYALKGSSSAKNAYGVYEYERYMGLDPLIRLHFLLPFNKLSGGEKKPMVCNEDDWRRLKNLSLEELEKSYTDEDIEKEYLCYREGHQKGEYPVRLSIQGFFWCPRELFGIEEHLLAFYDYPEVMHDINEFSLQVFFKKLDKVLDILPADIVYIKEDLSGSNGPMLSPGFFDEFVGAYYKRLIPFLKSKGVGHVFTDTDGDFKKLIPSFIEAGIDGFLPLDVNAGMDIVELRKSYPGLKFIGGFNKLRIAEGREAIDEEFKRLMPVIRKGGYIPGCDHQVAPSTPLSHYLYYISRLKEVMKECGKDI